MTTAATALQFASALSDAPDAADAVDQVVQSLSERLTGPIDLAVIFSSGRHAGDLPLIRELLTAALEPRIKLGMSAEGVIGVGKELERTEGLSVLAASLPGAIIQPLTPDDWDWRRAGDDPEYLAGQVATGDLANASVEAVFFLADPFTVPMVNVLPAFDEALPGVPVIGAMASHARSPGENRLLLGDAITDHGAVGLAIGGDVRVDATVSQGCRPIGKPLVITKSKRHIVQQLGGRNALEVVREMAQSLSDDDRELVQQGLLVGRVIDEHKERFGRGDFLIRGLLGIDPNSGAIAIADPQVRVGQTIQFHVRDSRTAQDDFSLLLDLQNLRGDAAGGLLFSCNGRGTRLFDHHHADAQLIEQGLGAVPLAGCFAAGEIGPIGGRNFLHGHTASLAVFRPA